MAIYDAVYYFQNLNNKNIHIEYWTTARGIFKFYHPIKRKVSKCLENQYNTHTHNAGSTNLAADPTIPHAV